MLCPLFFVLLTYVYSVCGPWHVCGDNFLEWVLALLIEAEPPSPLPRLCVPHAGWPKSFQALLSLPPILLEV